MPYPRLQALEGEFSVKKNLNTQKKMKSLGQKIVWLTCYDYSFASVLETTDIDLILVGDSGGMVLLGYEDTSPVSMDEMIFMCKAVRRGAPNKFVVGDMPKGSYEISDFDAVKNAMRFVKEGGCDAIKLEGGSNMASRVRAITQSGIPVIGHIGLTPQTSAQFGGYRVVGKSESEAKELLRNAQDLEASGVFAILLEATPPSVSEELAVTLSSIIFGIGAGPKTHGQLLILHDLLGLYPNFRPKFAKCYIPAIMEIFLENTALQEDLTRYGKETRRDGLREIASLAVSKYVEEVREGSFPGPEYSY